MRGETVCPVCGAKAGLTIGGGRVVSLMSESAIPSDTVQTQSLNAPSTAHFDVQVTLPTGRHIPIRSDRPGLSHQPIHHLR